jgi:signal transduction histidine kinase
LALVNAAIVFSLLLGFGFLSVEFSERRLIQSIDEMLEERTEPFANRPAQPSRPGLGMGWGPGGGQGRGFRRNQTEGQPPRDPLDALLRDAERTQDILRPRFTPRESTEKGVADTPWSAEAHQAALAGEKQFVTVQQDTQALRVASLPWRGRQGQIIGSVQTAESLKPYRDGRRAAVTAIWTMLPVALLFAVLASVFLARNALKPVSRMQKTAAEYSATPGSERIPVQGDDELARLAATFNEMFDRLEVSFEEKEQALQRLSAAYEAQKRFTADASHELRTPLSRIKLTSSAALSEPLSPEEKTKSLEIVDHSADQMDRLIQDLLALARTESGSRPVQKQPLPFDEWWDGLKDAYPELAEPRVTVEVETKTPLRADPRLLERAMVNLVQNALRHSGPSSPVRVRVAEDATEHLVEVVDEGEGVEAEHIPHLFDRFYRVDKARSREQGGSGLGLALCKSIVEAHGGTIGADSAPRKGSRFFFRLPKGS